MKRHILQLVLIILATPLFAQNLKPIKLNPPDKTRGLPVMEALSLRESVREFDTTVLKIQDLSDLLWAANGVNRPETGKRTAASANNSQDIDIYVFLKSGVYLYNAFELTLQPLVEGDYHNLIAGTQTYVLKAPVICLLVSDISKLKGSQDSAKLINAALDAGLVSQNISIFCAATDMATIPRVSMDQVKIREVLQLKESQRLMINNPVSY